MCTDTHNSDTMTIALIPERYQHLVTASGFTFLSAMVLVEATAVVASLAVARGLPFSGLLRWFRVGALDHWSHLGGYGTGAGMGWLLSKRWQERERERRKGGPGKARYPSWWGDVLLPR